MSTEIDLHRTDYDRASCDIGIVHLGFGAFHRAHAAVYIDDYMAKTGDLAWGIAAVNLRGSESAAFEEAQKAVNGYLLKTTSPQGEEVFRLVRSHIAFADWANDASDAEGLLSLPSVHAVSITVTESGYYLNDDWSLNVTDPVIASELLGGEATSVYGFLEAAVSKRKASTGAPLTILCCDNIRSNGKMLKNNFLSYLEHRKADELAVWVTANVTFPCSMVDRITPRTSQEVIDEVAELFPFQAMAPIHGESFTQWVIADDFAGPMPDLSLVGAQIVEDVDAFEEAKIRILNGGHTGLAYLGALAGLSTFDQAMGQSDLRAHFDRFEKNEVLPGLNFELPFDKNEYLGKIAERFSNAAIADNLERICMDGYSKIPVFVRPTITSCLEQGIEPTASYDCVASWVVYARRFAAGKMPIHYHEPYWDELAPMLVPGEEETLARESKIWGDLPTTYAGFVPGLVAAIDRMEQQWPV